MITWILASLSCFYAYHRCGHPGWLFLSGFTAACAYDSWLLKRFKWTEIWALLFALRGPDGHIIYCKGPLPPPNTGCLDNRCEELQAIMDYQ
ncbi:hypothetical protein [Methylobacter sp.]|uniref:hypothetical protein n=1 Tax=Methylobacter sp. TaxID=2051955 RepID=UPI00121F73D8|nr:hypothetical protein [Methylobacter sp.]TAK59537.1 MAG: hypothetical protein EPO18_20460 [Methylobacter sp.]